MATVKELLLHGKNYLIANIASKSLSFISIPIFTRLLTPEDYGINGVFLGTVLIFSSLYNLNIDKSISRYYYDQKDLDDFKSYVGSCYSLMFLLFCLSSLFLIVFRNFFANLFGINSTLLLFTIPIVFINVIISSFEQIYQPLKKSGLVAKFSTAKIYLIFIFSVPIICLLDTNKYYGLAWGQIIGGGIIVFCLCKYLLPFVKLNMNKKHIKYMFFYSIPLIPEALSGMLLEQFGKLYIGNSMGMDSAGYYTFVVSIASLVAIIVYVSNQAWVPYYFEYMNAKNYSSHDKDIKRILIVTLVGALFISFFGKEIAMVLAKSTYAKYLYLLPILCCGYVFNQLFFVYYRNISYSKKTIYMSLVVVASGIINILCNSILIPTYKELGAAISFSISYAVMAFLAWLVSRFIVKVHSTPVKSYIFMLVFYLIAEFILFFCFDCWNFGWNLLFRILLFSLTSLVIIGKELRAIISFSKQFIRK